mmetsp:Transcript_60103/g.158104  ORF Transcript_60103/g.158104 Transcript_60103/m.158104 type:complete len:375 (+) Transcript_60103:236-1360(+)
MYLRPSSCKKSTAVSMNCSCFRLCFLMRTALRISPSLALCSTSSSSRLSWYSLSSCWAWALRSERVCSSWSRSWVCFSNSLVHSSFCSFSASSFSARKLCARSWTVCSFSCPFTSASYSSLSFFSICAWMRRSASSRALSFFSSNLYSMSLMVLFFCSSSFSSLISWLANFVSFSWSACSRRSSACSWFTVCVASRSFFFTSPSRSCSRRSASTFATRFWKDISMRSLFVSSSHSTTCVRSACILARLPCTLGFSFRLRQRLLLLSLRRWATSWISVCVFMNFALLQRPFSAPLAAMSSSYLRSRSRCSWMMREISSPINWVSSSPDTDALVEMLERKLSFLSASSSSTCARKASTSDRVKIDPMAAGRPWADC